MNQNLLNNTEQLQNTSAFSESLRKLRISKPLDKKKDEYIKEIHSQKKVNFHFFLSRVLFSQKNTPQKQKTRRCKLPC